jgi:hypothetical protein
MEKLGEFVQMESEKRHDVWCKKSLAQHMTAK